MFTNFLHSPRSTEGNVDPVIQQNVLNDSIMTNLNLSYFKPMTCLYH